MPSSAISSLTPIESPVSENRLDVKKEQSSQFNSQLTEVRESAELPLAHSSPSSNSRSATAQKLRRALSDTDIKGTASPGSGDVIPLDYHTEKIDEFASFYSSVVQELETKTDALSNSLESARSDFQALKDLQLARKEGSRARAIAREGTISSLQNENTRLEDEIASLSKNIAQYDAIITKLEGTLSIKDHHLSMRDDNIKQKSDFLASKTRLIDNMGNQLKDLKEAHQSEINAKDRRFLELQGEHDNALASLQERLDSTQHEKLLLQQQVDALTTTSNQFTLAKSEALRKATKTIADEAEALKTLNTALVSKLKDANSKNTESIAEIAKLKSALYKLCERIGIRPEDLI